MLSTRLGDSFRDPTLPSMLGGTSQGAGDTWVTAALHGLGLHAGLAGGHGRPQDVHTADHGGAPVQVLAVGHHAGALPEPMGGEHLVHVLDEEALRETSTTP